MRLEASLFLSCWDASIFHFSYLIFYHRFKPRIGKRGTAAANLLGSPHPVFAAVSLLAFLGGGQVGDLQVDKGARLFLEYLFPGAPHLHTAALLKESSPAVKGTIFPGHPPIGQVYLF